MCGRFALKTPRARLSERFGLAECMDLVPRYNIPPGTEVAAIRVSPEGKRVLHLLRWGLVPHWAKDSAIGAKLSNARAEGVADKPSFRDAFRCRRCLMPADGFYEWQTRGKDKQPYFIHQDDTFAMAGLWSSWRQPDGGVLRTCCIITTGPNGVMAPIHDRMPVIVAPADWERWLTAPGAAVQDLLRPCPDADLRAWPVDRRVNRTADDDPGLMDPISLDALAPPGSVS